MNRHWQSVLFLTGIALTIFIVAILNAWYLAAIAVVLFAVFGGAAWTLVVARIEGRPSDEDKEHPERNSRPGTGRLPPLHRT